MIELVSKFGTAKITIDEVEDACIQQLYNIISSPLGSNDIVIMPDCHAGRGAVVGYTQPLQEKICPNLIGSDIGCGMLSFKVDKIPDTLKNINHQIKRSIPTGTFHHKECQLTPTEWNDLFNTATLSCQLFVIEYNKKFGTNYNPIKYDMDWLDKKLKQIKLDPIRAKNSIGTLGGGNHFIEIGEANNGGYWVTVHSGSRKFGEAICDLHQFNARHHIENKRSVDLQSGIINIRKEYAENPKLIEPNIKKLKKELGLDFEIDIKGLEYLEFDKAMDYLFDMVFAQQYAVMNRKIMSELIMRNIFKGQEVIDHINCTHNYIDFNDMIIRKGSISSYTGSRAIIPFNMEDGLLIIEGKSNPEWNFSAPHGAGRIMSRSQAKSTLSLEEMKKGMDEAGVFSTSLNKNTLDEAKGAYKSAELIEMAIEPTAIILEKVKPILNIKDDSNSMSWKEKREEKKKREEIKNKEIDELAYKKMKKIK